MKESKPDRAAEKARERDRLAAALRENLKKRKTQARERDKEGDGSDRPAKPKT